MRGGLEIRNDDLSASLHSQTGPGSSGLFLFSHFPMMELGYAVQLYFQLLQLGATMLLL